MNETEITNADTAGLPYVDTHCHLSSGHFDADRDAVIEHCRKAGVRMVAVGADLPSSRISLEMAKKRPDLIRAAVGIHPNDVAGLGDSDWAALEELAKSQFTAALGETGLDYHWKRVDPDEQKAAFRRHLNLAESLRKPVVVHARDSVTDVLAMLEPFLANGGKAVWHCFVAGKKEIGPALDFAAKHRLFLGIGGLVTFEDQKPLRSIAPQIPDELLLLETDAPYLSPRPKKSDRNTPDGVIRVAEELAVLRRVSPVDVARLTTRNACRLFGLDLPHSDPAIAYRIRDSLYLALTVRCNNNCVFCARNDSFVVKGHDLKLAADPSADEVIRAMGDVRGYKEVVFCGFGEPTLRLDVLKAAAAEARRQGVPVRLNTNGLANLEHGRDITPELVGLVRTVSVSLNTANPGQYERLCRPRFGAAAYPAILDFVRRAVAAGLETVCTVVATPEIDVEAARRIAINLGASFRIREYNQVG